MRLFNAAARLFRKLGSRKRAQPPTGVIKSSAGVSLLVGAAVLTGGLAAEYTTREIPQVPSILREVFTPLQSGDDVPGTVGLGPGTADSIPAFPRCKGPGCGALQQYRVNGIRVHHVTVLTPAVTNGSLVKILIDIQADSLMANKPLDIVVFDVAGQWEWSQAAVPNHWRGLRGVLIDASSAPGPVLTGRWASFLLYEAEDVVMRGMAWRGVLGSTGSYLFRVSNSRRIVVDHNSFSHGPQRQVSFYGDTTAELNGIYSPNLCMKWSQFSHNFFGYKTIRTGNGLDEDLSDPPTMFMLSGLPRGQACTMGVGVNQNVVTAISGTGTAYRMPNSSAHGGWIHQNYLYNGSGGGAWMAFDNGYINDVTYNYYRYGPNTGATQTSTSYFPASVDSLGHCRQSNDIDYPCDVKSLYVDHNHYDRRSTDWSDVDIPVIENWELGPNRILYPRLKSTSLEAPVEYRRYTPMTVTFPFGMDTLPMTDAVFQGILDSAGAGRRIDSLGRVVMIRDTVDKRARKAVIDRARYVQPGDTHRDSFRILFYPDVSSLVHAPCRNADGDAMCDAWEEMVYGSNALNETDIQLSGYSALELFLAGNVTDLDEDFGYGTTPPPPSSVPSDLAFRGAQGYGRNTIAACRDSVYYGPDGIHGNADDWPLKIWLVDGSVRSTPEAALGLRTIVEDSTKDKQYDIVIIKEGGVYSHDYSTGALLINTSCTYITSAPASGDGAALIYRESGPWVFKIKMNEDQTGKHDQMLRDIRVWSDSGGVYGDPLHHGQNNVFQLWGGRNIYLDHMTFVGGEDGSEFYGNSDTLDNLTVDYGLWSGSAFTCDPSWTGTSWALDGYDAEGDSPLLDVSLLRTAFMVSEYRMPALGSSVHNNHPDSLSMVGAWENINTMSFDQLGGGRYGNYYGNDSIDIIQSWFGEPTATNFSTGPLLVRGCRSPNTGDCYEGGGNDYQWFVTPKIYIDSMFYYEAKVFQDSNKNLFYYRYGISLADTELPDSMRKSTRNNTSVVPSDSIWKVADVPDSLWTSASPRHRVGANRNLTCGGTFVMNQDSTTDWFYNRYVNNQQGNIHTTICGWNSEIYRDNLEPGTPCVDTDGDGLPNAFETWSGVTDADSLLGGFLAIELYLNGDSAYLADLLTEPPTPAPTTRVNVFPGAVGAGAEALSGGTCNFSTSTVLHVTSLSDGSNALDGANTTGTLRNILGYPLDNRTAAVENYPDDMVKYIVFDVSGVIETNVPAIQPQVPCIIVAGQASPGNGVWIAPLAYNHYRSFSTTQFKINSVTDAVVTNLRFTAGKDSLCKGCGYQDPGTEDADGPQGDAAAFSDNTRILLGWNQFIGGNDGISDQSTNNGLTSMYNLFAAAYLPHATASLSQGLTTTSRYRNIYVGGRIRQPAFAHTGADEEWIENVMYDAASKFGRLGRDNEGGWCTAGVDCDTRVDMIGNLYMSGPSETNPMPLYLVLDSRYIDGNEKTDYTDALFATNNFVHRNGTHYLSQIDFIQWTNAYGSDALCATHCDLTSGEWDYVTRATRLTLFTDLKYPIIPTLGQDSALIQNTVLSDVGTSWLLNCDGSMKNSNDAVRSKYVGWVNSNYMGGDISPDSIQQHNSVNVAYGVPTNLGTSTAACSDTDNDGLPDAFELRWWGSATSSQTRNDDPDEDGYTNMIEYLYPFFCGTDGCDPTVFTNSDGSSGGALPDPGLCPSGTTYKSNCRNVYLVDTVVDTLITDGGADTTISRQPDPTYLPSSEQSYRPIFAPDTLTAMIVTLDTFAITLEDSIAVRSRAQGWGLPADTVLTIPIPGN